MQAQSHAINLTEIAFYPKIPSFKPLFRPHTPHSKFVTIKPGGGKSPSHFSTFVLPHFLHCPFPLVVVGARRTDRPSEEREWRMEAGGGKRGRDDGGERDLLSVIRGGGEGEKSKSRPSSGSNLPGCHNSGHLIYMFLLSSSPRSPFPVWSLVLGAFSHLLMVANSSMNILFYCVFNAQFRVEAKKAFLEAFGGRRAVRGGGGGSAGGGGHRRFGGGGMGSGQKRNGGGGGGAVTKVEARANGTPAGEKEKK